ncbi:MAG: inositol monophosphatase family protein [Verrucomicrobiota bacterium]
MTEFLKVATEAAHAAGGLLRENFERPLLVNAATRHDIKLDLDVRAQELITRTLLSRFPEHALYGEEGIVGDQASQYQWVVDPLDGTVNFFYGIPHFCVSIALRCEGEVILGVIFDPMRDELWSTSKGAKSILNGRVVHVSKRAELIDSIVSVGLAKTDTTINLGLPLLTDIVHRVRKCRMLGSAALDLAYVCCGRLDAYIEQGISLWDVAAGSLLVQNAGGIVDLRPRPDLADRYSIIASSGAVDLGL